MAARDTGSSSVLWPWGLWLLTQHLSSKTTSWLCDLLQVAHLQFPLLCNGDAFSYPVGVLNGGRNNHPLQYSCLGNTMDPGAWWATLHGVMKSRTRLRHSTKQRSAEKVKHVNTRPWLHRTGPPVPNACPLPSKKVASHSPALLTSPLPVP